MSQETRKISTKNNDKEKTKKTMRDEIGASLS